MAKRLIIAIVAALMLVVSVLAASASTHNSTNANNGSWLGVLDASDTGPNIPASLCLGASLDFSAASASRCTQQSKKTRSANAGHSGTTVVQETPQFEYAALGDSIAAGAGLPENNNGTCDRSAAAYPYHIAAVLNVSFIHVACQGATMNDLLVSQRIVGPNPAPQLDSAFAAGTPQLITITAGANDARWQTVLLRCLRRTCGTDSDTRTVQVTLASLHNETQAVFNEIAMRSSGTTPQVVLTGYYNPIASCVGADSRITSSELAWINDQLHSLNQTLASAAAGYSFVTFVPIDFTGHDLCSSDPWVQGTRNPAPLHPTAAGQQAIAQMILGEL